jgi:nucleoside-diphosphate-sugar epimerase
MPDRATTSRANDGRRLVLITGGADFIGSNLADALIERGYRVRIVDNLSTGLHERVNKDAELVDADIRELYSIRSAFNSVGCVFHVAELPRVLLSIEKPLETHMVNVVGTLNVLLAARDANVRRFVFSGSSSIRLMLLLELAGAGEMMCLGGRPYPSNRHRYPQSRYKSTTRTRSRHLPR